MFAVRDGPGRQGGRDGDDRGEVRDVASGQKVWSKNPAKALMPASTDKLATAVAALTVLGPGHTVRTKAVYRSGTVYLVGGGDQQLGSADLKSLASAAAKSLKAKNQHAVRLMFDDHLFATPGAGRRRHQGPGRSRRHGRRLLVARTAKASTG
ncbi:D-alanyl-D-alanine carboxypeptidase [Streptomyces prunicolor]|uniref:D-alanyl-D-alanine carboxypeptidase n=1 Tax=Streptomyces prunicolor TaxID=67348 RepID=UPI00225110EA|nr:D-alanyl-D-alanine carboxypeptidase [Streptomyces prunicolor]MCX5236007.1 D-alanyl-D-alanine carboxypeptidase [Streptomyces prunicolor]